MKADKTAHRLLNLSPYSLILLLIVTPLIFLTFIQSSFDLAKKTSLVVLGGIFIILSLLYLISNFFNNDESSILVDKKIDPIVFFFLIAAFLSASFSIKTSISFNGQYLRQIGFITYFYLFLVYFLASQVFKPDTSIRKSGLNIGKVLSAIELTAGAAGLYAILQYFRLDPFSVPMVGATRPVSTLGHSIFAGGLLMMVLPFSINRIFSSAKPVLAILSCICIMGGIVVTQSRSAYAGAILIVIILLIALPFIYKAADREKFKKLLRINLLVLCSGITMLFIMIIFFPSNPFIAKLLDMREVTDSARWILWRDSLEAYKLHPFIGSGIGTFASVFEFYTSYRLKALEPKNLFDHAHNVYINTLVTMGALGALAYILMLLQGVLCSLKGFLSSTIEKKDRLFFLSVLASLAGYLLYSFSAFENTAMLLYLFIIFAMLKVTFAEYFNDARLSFNIRSKNSIYYVITVISSGIILFCIYNFYPSYNNILADLHYKKGIEHYSSGDFKGMLNELNLAVILNNDCADYKFTLAKNVQDFCLKNPGLKNETKMMLLNQAEHELERAGLNFFLYLQAKSLQAMIKLQLGDTAAFNKLKNEVFQHDTIVVNFRINLARYNFINNRIPEMMNDLNSILSIDPYNSEAVIILTSYYGSINDKAKALEVCEKYLHKYPLDPYVLSVKQKILDLP